jgi:hypothetical protein
VVVANTARVKVRVLRTLLGALLCVLGALPACAAGPFVKELTWKYQGKEILVSLSVGDALAQPEMREQIESTRPVSLTFTIEVVRKRNNWADKPIFRRVVVRTVHYDNLTRHYKLLTEINGKKADERTVATWEEMATYMENVRDLAAGTLPELDFKEGSYAVRGKVHVKSNFVMVIIPWDVQTPWEIRNLPPP